MSRYIEKSRNTCRRPIEPSEVSGLEALAAALYFARWRECHLSRPELGSVALVSISQLAKIETAQRRTRRSTLRRIADALGTSRSAERSVDEYFNMLISAAGKSLAPESEYTERIERRRLRRARLGRFAPPSVRRAIRRKCLTYPSAAGDLYGQIS